MLPMFNSNDNFVFPNFVRLLLLSCGLLFTIYTSANEGAEESEDALNERFLQLSQASLIAHAKSLKPTNFTKIEKLAKEINRLNKDEYVVDALATLITNINLVYKNIDHKLIPDLTWFLYSHNLKISADAIVEYAKTNSDPYSFAKIQLQQAKYYFIIGDWSGALNTLNSVDAFSALSESDANYSYLIRGIALQRLKKHREALGYYEKVGKNSEYYTVTLLNSALANIRQGWWTDAHLLLQKAIDIELKEGNTNFVDRLYLTHGFSLLQNEFYRDARENFRSIGIDSPLVNRAMLGIAISAMHQDDFIGALNMLTTLREKQENSASVHEAYLLIPFVYEKIDQLRLAAANYNQAEAHFKSYSAALRNERQSVNTEYVLELTRGTAPSLLEFTQTSTKTTGLDPLTRLNIRLLSQLISLEHNKTQLLKLQTLQQHYIHKAIVAIQTQLEEQQQVSDSYLSQTRFSLANLYDK